MPIIVAEAGTAFGKRHDYTVEMASPVRDDDLLFVAESVSFWLASPV